MRFIWKLTYQIGSEEYVEWTAHINDAFQLQVDGHTISLTPDAAQVLGVNTVHRYIAGWERPGAYPPDDLAAAYEYLYFDNPYSKVPGKIEYDGMVVTMRAHVFFTPDSTRWRHARLDVADTSDTDYDSALFIKKQSITSITP